MKKTLALLVLALTLCLSKEVKSQGFRNMKWGMSIDQVKQAETTPLSNEEKSWTGTRSTTTYYNGVDLTYDNVTVSEKKATIYYHFDNGKLTKIRVVFRHDLYTNYNDNMTSIVQRFINLVITLQNKGYKFVTPIQCGEHAYSGADYSNPINSRLLTMTNDGGVSDKKLALIEQMIREKQYHAAFFRMQSPSSRLFVMFATQYSEFKKDAPVIMEITPSVKIENELKKSDF